MYQTKSMKRKRSSTDVLESKGVGGSDFKKKVKQRKLFENCKVIESDELNRKRTSRNPLWQRNHWTYSH